MRKTIKELEDKMLDMFDAGYLLALEDVLKLLRTDKTKQEIIKEIKG